MPRKPHRLAIKQEPIASPMRTRSSNKSVDRMPALASLIAAALQINDSSSPSPVKKKPRGIAPAVAATPPKATSKAAAESEAPTMSPSKPNGQKRRKRESITLPPGVSLSSLSQKELRRLKNRIAANRMRKRSQQSAREMEQQLEAYKRRCEFLESVVSGCSTCAILSAVQFGEIELLPAEPIDQYSVKKETTSDEEELESEHNLPTLSEAECFVLGDVLRC